MPRPPRKEHFIVSNSTSLTLRPSSWDDGGCPISHLTIEYRPRSGGSTHSQWIVVSRNLSPDEGPMTLHDLRPETWYNVRVTATNDAGSTDAEFTVRTVPNSHGKYPIDTPDKETMPRIHQHCSIWNVHIPYRSLDVHTDLLMSIQFP